MSWLSIRRVPERCLWGALIFSTVSQSYRYPFKISFSGTSPTYSDTPVALQIPKFLLMMLLCSIVLKYLPSRLLAFRQWTLVVWVFCLSGYAVFKAAFAQSGTRTDYIDTAFWPLTVLIIVIAVKPVQINAIDRYFRFVLIYALISNAVEIALFITIGRLPALAYENSFSVRFGGFLDDPNAFGALLYMLLGWVHFRYAGYTRLLLEAALLLCVLLTQSLTAIGFLILLGLFFALRAIVWRPEPLLLIAICVLSGTALYFLWSPLSVIVTGVLDTKSTSVDSHLAQVGGSNGRESLSWLLGTSSYQGYESWWLVSLVNFGVGWCLLCWCFIGRLLWSVFVAFRKARKGKEKAVFSGVLALSCYFAVGNANLPLYKIYPVDFLFFFFAYLVFFERIAVVEAPYPQKGPQDLIALGVHNAHI